MNLPRVLHEVKQRRAPLWVGALALFVALVPVYLFSVDIRASWGASITGDEPFYLIATQSLLQDGDFDTSNQFANASYETFFDHADGLWRQSVARADGALLSPHNPGLSVLLLPGFAVGGLLGAQVQMILIAAATFALTFVFVARLTRFPRVAWGSVLAVALTAPAFVYSSAIYPEVPAALAVVVALLLLQPAPIVGPRRAVLVVLALTALPWLGIKYAPLVVVIGLYAAWRQTPRARLVMLVGGLVSGLAYIWFHISVYGGLTPYGLNLVYAGQSTVGITSAHIEFLERAYRLWGLFIDQRFGIGRWAPVLLVSAVATPLLWKSGSAARLVLALFAAQILAATFIAITMMGWWFPGRTLITVLPLAALPVAYAWQASRPALRAVIVVAALYSVAITIAFALAGHAREVTSAVNPFDLRSAIFTIPTALFPNYTSWTAHTWVTTALWLAVPASALVILASRRARPRL